MKETKNKGFRKGWVYFFILILVVSLFFSYILISNQIKKQKFLDEYNQQVDDFMKIAQKHDDYRAEINNFKERTDEYYSKIESFDGWMDTNRPKVYDFKTYLEDNYELIKKYDGKNPDYLRENVKEYIDFMDKNKQQIREELQLKDLFGDWDLEFET